MLMLMSLETHVERLKMVHVRLTIEPVPCFMNSVLSVSMEGFVVFSVLFFFFSDLLTVPCAMANAIKMVLNVELDN